MAGVDSLPWKIGRVRALCGLSQVEAARALGVTVSMVRRSDRGDGEVRMQFLEEYARLLGYRILFRRKGEL